MFVLSPTGRLAAPSPPAIVGESQPLTALINLKAGSAAHVPQHPAATFLRRGQEAASAAAAASQLARPFPIRSLDERDLVHATDGLTPQHAAAVLQPQPGASPARSMLTSRHTIVLLPRLQLCFTLNDVLVYVESSFFF